MVEKYHTIETELDKNYIIRISTICGARLSLIILIVLGINVMGYTNLRERTPNEQIRAVFGTYNISDMINVYYTTLVAVHR